MQTIAATDADINNSPAVQFTLKSVDVTSGGLTEAQVRAIINVQSTGEVHLNGDVSAGLTFVLTIEASDNPLDVNQPDRYVQWFC